jgi:hypothetical protein
VSLLDILRTPDPNVAGQIAETMDVRDQLNMAEATIDLLESELRESLADVELGLEDRSWRALSSAAEVEFTRHGLLTAARLCRVMAIVNPLVKRALNLRSAYVWGEGVEISARATGSSQDNQAEQDVNAVVQEFLDDKATLKVFTSAAARETNERTLGTDGIFALALFTMPLTGRVQPREIASDEIVDVICNPDDAAEVWFYKRQWVRKSVSLADGTPVTETVTTYYPDIDYRPRGARPVRVNGEEVMWDAPMAVLTVNGLSGWQFGIGDAFAAIPWARAYKEFLEDWAKLVKSLSRFAWRLSAGSKSKATTAATAVAKAMTSDPTGLSGDKVGGAAIGGPNMGTLEAIPKSGATIDSGSGKPLAGMVAAGMDVPVTMLLADPGVTGARATAETLDRPTELMAKQRREVWADFHKRVLGYVIDQAVKAPRGALKGTVTRDEWGREVVTLAGDTERTIEISWPDLTETPVDILVTAITTADDTRKLPPLTIAKLLLQALGVTDADEILETLVDEDGNWQDPYATAGSAAADAFRRGEDPAGALA